MLALRPVFWREHRVRVMMCILTRRGSSTAWCSSCGPCGAAHSAQAHTAPVRERAARSSWLCTVLHIIATHLWMPTGGRLTLLFTYRIASRRKNTNPHTPSMLAARDRTDSTSTATCSLPSVPVANPPPASTSASSSSSAMAKSCNKQPVSCVQVPDSPQCESLH